MKRVLIVYHSFDEWEMGPIRIRRIARNLPAAGYEPIVLTSEKSARTAAEIPDGVTCLRAGGLDLAELYRSLRRRLAGGTRTEADGSASPARNNRLTSIINRWFMVPDKQITWKRAALNVARSYLRENPVDVIFASLAPRTNLLVAVQLADEFNLPCVVEFRDLWTGSPYYHLSQPTAVHRALHRRLERKAIRGATCVTAVCRGLASYLDRHYGDLLRHPVSIHYNFYDPAEYPELPEPKRDGPMTLSYIGALYASRSPLSFFRGLRKFIDANAVDPADFRFRWAGSVIGVSGVDEAIAELKLGPYIDRLGQLGHAEAVTELCQSDASLLIQAPGDDIHIPGKLFESLGAGVPVLAVADEGEVRELVERIEAGVTCTHEPGAIAEGLQALWNRYREAEGWTFNEPERTRFRADRVVGSLASLLDEARHHHDA